MRNGSHLARSPPPAAGSPLAPRGQYPPERNQSPVGPSPSASPVLQFQPKYTYIGEYANVSVYWCSEVGMFRALKKIPVEKMAKRKTIQDYYDAVDKDATKAYPCIARRFRVTPPVADRMKAGEIEHEYVPGTSLDELVLRMRQCLQSPWFDDTQVFLLIYGLARTLRHLHAMGVVHGSVRPENVLVSAELEPYLADFCTDKLGCAAAYAAPEVSAGSEYGVAADVYSFGCVVTDLLTLQVPASVDGRVELPVTSVYREIVAACLMKNPQERWDMKKVVAALKKLGSDKFDGSKAEDYVKRMKRATPTKDRFVPREEEGSIKNMRKAAKRGMTRAQILYGVICEKHRIVFDPVETEEQGTSLKMIGRLSAAKPAVSKR